MDKKKDTKDEVWGKVIFWGIILLVVIYYYDKWMYNDCLKKVRPEAMASYPCSEFSGTKEEFTSLGNGYCVPKSELSRYSAQTNKTAIESCKKAKIWPKLFGSFGE